VVISAWCHIWFQRASEYVSLKTRSGEIDKAQPFLDMADNAFLAWGILIIVAVIVALIAKKGHRGMIILFQVVLLPSIEFFVMLLR